MIDDKARAILARISDCAEHGQAAPTAPMLGREIGKGETAVRRRLDAMEEAGMIRVENGPQNARRIYVASINRWTGWRRPDPASARWKKHRARIGDVPDDLPTGPIHPVYGVPIRQCPPGHAAGLSQIETHCGTVAAPGMPDWTRESAQRGSNKAKANRIANRRSVA